MQHRNRPSKYLKRNSQVRAKFQAYFNPTYHSGGKTAAGVVRLLGDQHLGGLHRSWRQFHIEALLLALDGERAGESDRPARMAVDAMRGASARLTLKLPPSRCAGRRWC
jgi:hypothetical protein